MKLIDRTEPALLEPLAGGVAPPPPGVAEDDSGSELRRAKSFFRAAFDAPADTMAILDERGTILEVNRAWERFALENGLRDPRAARGAYYLGVCDAAAATSPEAAAAARGIREVLAGGRASFELAYPCHAPAEARWFLLRVSRFDDGDGVRALVTHQDVTAQRAADERLRESESRYRRLVETTHEGVWTMDATGKTTYANARMAEMLGVTPAAMLGVSFFDFMDAEDAFEARTLFVRQQRRISEARECRLLRPEGEALYALMSLSPQYDDDGEVAGTLAMFGDITARRTAERARDQALEALQALVAASPVAIITLDTERRVTRWNRAAEAMFGWSAAEVLGRPVPILPDDRQHEATRIWEAHAAQQVTRELETQRRHKDGHLLDVLLSSVVLHDRDGAVVGIVALFMDISAHKRAERERGQLLSTLEFERNRLVTLFQQAPAFLAVMRGRDHVFEMANDAYYRLVGSRDLIGRPALEALPERQEQGLEEILDRVYATGESVAVDHMRVMLQRTPGAPLEERFVNCVYQALEEADGSRSGILAHGVDITEQVRGVAVVTESEARYRLLFEQSPMPMWVIDQETLAFLTVNDAAVAHYGYSREEFLGMTVATLHRTDGSALRARLRVDAGQRHHAVGRRHFTKGDEVRHVDVTSFGLVFAGRPARLAVIVDVTERMAAEQARQELEEELRQAQKMEAVGRLAGGVAHDFNNLLTVIRANADFLLEALDASDPRRRDAQEVRTAADRAAGLTRQLLAFSRRQILDPRPLDLNATVAGVRSMLERLLGEDIAIEAALAPSLGTVMADAGQVEQVLMNLAVNARDAMPGGGRLRIETAAVELDQTSTTADQSVVRPGRYALLAVSDSGVGMSPEVQRRVFEPFFTTKPQGEGTGLGLSTVYGIVKQSGGHIALSSEPGLGTTFRIYFPSIDVAATAPPPAAAAAAGRSSGTVLLAEDEDGVRAVALRILVRAGYTVLPARHGAEALEVAARHPGHIDLVLTDVVMPGMGGRALVEALRTVRPESEVLYMSGYTAGDIVRRGVLEPGVAFVQKPFTQAGLLEAVRRCLARVPG